MICFRSQAQNSKSVHSDSLPCLLLGSHLTSATFCFLIGKKAQHYVPQRIASHTRWCIERQFVKPPAVHSSFPVMPQIYFAPLSSPPPFLIWFLWFLNVSLKRIGWKTALIYLPPQRAGFSVKFYLLFN